MLRLYKHRLYDYMSEIGNNTHDPTELNEQMHSLHIQRNRLILIKTRSRILTVFKESFLLINMLSIYLCL